VERLRAGGFASRSRLDDALTIAVMETAVPLWALDGDSIEGRPGIRTARGGEALGRSGTGRLLPEGRLVVADDRAPLAALFGDPAPEHGVTRRTTRIVLFSVVVAGVPDLYVEEALWTCAGILAAD
jgi:DNA/RNA-binding domain of Phe-tRNA-synthetase-like protein